MATASRIQLRVASLGFVERLPLTTRADGLSINPRYPLNLAVARASPLEFDTKTRFS